MSTTSEMPSGINSSLNVGGATHVSWVPASGGLYSVGVAFEPDSIPKDVLDSFLNWRQPYRATWDAQLTVNSGGVRVFKTETLTLTRSSRSSHEVRFHLVDLSIEGGELLDVCLTSTGPIPFEAPGELSIRPTPATSARGEIGGLLHRVAQIAFLLALLGMISSRRVTRSLYGGGKMRLC